MVGRADHSPPVGTKRAQNLINLVLALWDIPSLVYM